MIEDILWSTTKLVSSFLSSNASSTTFTSWGCDAVVQRTAHEFGRTVRQGRTRALEHFVGTNTGVDEQLGCKSVVDDSWDIWAPNRVRFVPMAF